MKAFSRRQTTSVAAVGVTAAALVMALPGVASAKAPAPAQPHTLSPNAHFFVKAVNPGSMQQLQSLVKSKDIKDAALLTDMLVTPQAVWLTGGTPAQVESDVRSVVRHAAAQAKAVPAIVLYNVPGRDCSQYSAGGASTSAEYRAWVDGVVKGLGNSPAVVLVEPDGLANLPSDCASAYPGADIAALTAERIADVKYAATQVENNDSKSLVYLDAGHSAWHNVGDMAQRLYEAGVGDVQGFYLNASNYQFTANSIFFGTWISDCLAYATPLNSTGTAVAAGDWGSCGNQYWNGGPANNWSGVAMSPYGQWSETASDPALNTSGVTSRYADQLGSVQPTAHFVIDTSRNGRGPNDMSKYAGAPYNQPANVISALMAGNWCNPPDSGIGLLPTANTGVPLLDAYLWIKTPGESDGTCDIAGGARAWDYSAYNPWGLTGEAQNHFDPLWGEVDPAAGAWFPQQALQLVRDANPPLHFVPPHFPR